MSSEGTTQNVQVFPKIAYRSEQPKPHIVKWRVAGRDTSKSFSKKRSRRDADETAERFQDRLRVAVAAGEAFSVSTKRPVSWEQEGPVALAPGSGTYYEWAIEHAHRKWPTLKASSRKSMVEGITAAVVSLLDEDPTDRDRLRRHVAAVLSPSGSSTDDTARSWLQDHSHQLSAIGRAEVDALLSDLGRKADGNPVAATTFARMRNVVNHSFVQAIRHDRLPHNPLVKGEKRAVAVTRRLDTGLVMTQAEAEALITLAAANNPDAERFHAWWATMLYAGLRPSEASGLHVSDLDLPHEGWGLVRVWGGTVTSAPAFTDTGKSWSDEGQKWRAVDAEARRVPLPANLVKILRDHIARWERPEDGRVFVNRLGNPLSSANTGGAWRQAREELYPLRRTSSGEPMGRRHQHPLSETTCYGLRHTAATTWIKAGALDSAVAKRLGHSPYVLGEIYEGVFQDGIEEANALIDAAAERAAQPSESPATRRRSAPPVRKRRPRSTRR